jgi:hypothetical protein
MNLACMHSDKNRRVVKFLTINHCSINGNPVRKRMTSDESNWSRCRSKDSKDPEAKFVAVRKLTGLPLPVDLELMA